jgi:GNAT superfamily N-acetyltransferase
MLIRSARVSDVPAMAAIKHDAGLAAWAHILPPAVIEALRMPPRWIAAVESADDRVRMLIAETEGRVLGFAFTRPSGDEDAAHATGELDGFYVDPGSWGRGVGRALLAAATEILRRAGFAEATLWTAAENHRPRRIYEDAGWQLDGTDRRRELGGVEFVEVRYRLPLGRLESDRRSPIPTRSRALSHHEKPAAKKPAAKKPAGKKPAAKKK